MSSNDGVMRLSASGSMAGVGVDDLFRLWNEQGVVRARDELVVRFLPLARKLARRYANRNEPLDDLMQVASLGLVKAVDRFDPKRGWAFSSFAVPTILGELRRHFRDTGWAVHVPRGMQELSLRVSEAERRLSDRSGRSVTVPELAQYLEVSFDEVVEALEARGAHYAASLEVPVGDGDDDRATLADTLGAEDRSFDRVEASVTIEQASQDLSEREREVLRLYHLEEHTQAEIATRLGVSQMQVSRLQRRVVERLREASPRHPAQLRRPG